MIAIRRSAVIFTNRHTDTRNAHSTPMNTMYGMDGCVYDAVETASNFFPLMNRILVLVFRNLNTQRQAFHTERAGEMPMFDSSHMFPLCNGMPCRRRMECVVQHVVVDLIKRQMAFSHISSSYRRIPTIRSYWRASSV